MMLRKALIVAVLVLAVALPTVGREYTDVTNYGNCKVGSIVDPISDDTGAYFFCGSPPLTILFFWEPGDERLSLAIQTEGTKRVADTVPSYELGRYNNARVRFRVDRGDVLNGNGYRLEQDGLLHMQEFIGSDGRSLFFMKLLSHIRNGTKLHMSIDGGASDTIELHGASEAVPDFSGRLKLTLVPEADSDE